MNFNIDPDLSSDMNGGQKYWDLSTDFSTNSNLPPPTPNNVEFWTEINKELKK